MTSPPTETMKQKNNNESKGNQTVIFPDEFRKCFFVLESKISPVELAFVREQISRRTNFNFRNTDSIFRLGLEFLLFFIEGIRPDLSNFGSVLADSLVSKLKEQITKYQ